MTNKYINYKMLERQNPENLCKITVYKPLESMVSSGAREIKENLNYSSVTGIISPTTNFTMGASSSYQDIIGNVKWLDTLQQYVNIGGTMAGSDENPISQFAFKSLRLSEQQYMGSKVNDFSINLQIPILSREDNPWKIAKGLFEYVLSERGGTFNSGNSQITSFVQSSQKELVLFAPHRYRINWQNNDLTSNLGGEGDDPRGCATIQIGNRFLFRRVLVTDVSIDFNNIIYIDGKVTNMSARVSFKPWRQPDLAEMKSWFIGDGRTL